METGVSQRSLWLSRVETRPVVVIGHWKWLERVLEGQRWTGIGFPAWRLQVNMILISGMT